MAAIAPEDRTLPRVVKRAATLFAEQIAIQQDGEALSYQALAEQGRRAAAAFHAAGIARGDRVAIWAPNIIPWVIAAIGLQSCGAILVPLNTRMKGSEAADILRRSGARLLLTVAEFVLGANNSIRYLELLKGEELPALERRILLQGEAGDAQSWEAFLHSGKGVADASIDALMMAVRPDDIMDMLFTSGTTGKPKGVLCDHGQNIQVFEVWGRTVGVRSDDHFMVIPPFFHSFGYKAGWLAAIIAGARILPVVSFDIDEVLAQIERDRVSVLPGPPTIYQAILMHPDRHRYDLSSLRLAVTGAAAIPVELIRRMREELGFESVVTAYGLTESSGTVSICQPGDSAETIATTSGCAIPGVEIRCVDTNGKELPRGEPGEIWVRGYNVMRGYFDNPEATAETITEDGWLKTGDVGVMDERGYIRITDRIKDMYISGGFNVYPAEIENALSSLPGVAQVAVIGVADERMGELGKAFIVRDPDSTLSEEQVIAWCRERMANYKVPRQVEFIAAMPLNASGKILKTRLREGL